MICEYSGGDPAMEWSTVDPELEKNQGVNQETGAVADHCFESFSLLEGGEGLVAHCTVSFVCAGCDGELRLRSL